MSRKGWSDVLLSSIADLFIPIVSASIGLCFAVRNTPTEIDRSAWYAVSVGIPFCVGYVATDIVRNIWERLRLWSYLENDLKTPIAGIQSTLEGFSVYSAFHTDHGHLETLLNKSVALRTKARWLLPKFISKKLSQEISSASEASFKMKPKDFSALLQDFIPYCSQSLFMTCPYTPSLWFKRLLEGSGKVDNAQKENDLEEVDMPPHVQTLLRVHGVQKKRIVVLQNEEDLKDFFSKEHIGFLSNFLKFSNSKYRIDTRFAYYPIMCGNDCKLCVVATRDLQIWDDAVVIEYDMKGSENCSIRLEPDRYYKKLFSSAPDGCFVKDCNYTLEEMQKYLTDLKHMIKGRPTEVEFAKWKIKVRSDPQTGDFVPVPLDA